MVEIDFITAFGRLLHDGNLRDLFAASPQAAAGEIHLQRRDWPYWEQIVPADVEFQALVLLRKRLDLVKLYVPETCRQAGEKLWPAFLGYARTRWPAAGSAKVSDAFQFCRHLRQQDAKTVAAAEWNRLDFVCSKRRAAWYWVRMPTNKGGCRSGLQVFLRGSSRRWRELFLYPGL